ncbi:CoA transferase subunit A [Hyphococcus sp. DH-69]|uniref:CoA transferase subunit A n=1 Tax=Hyphococcus formosus TaxID=3143534 RepID=UPI00398B68D5
MLNKVTSIENIVDNLEDGMTIAIGGWATRRKPMALIRAIARSSVKDLTIISYGGPDVGTLCAAKKIRKLIFGFVSLDHIPLDPHFQLARQSGELEVIDLDEGMVHLGLRAAAMRLPFLPTRLGIGTSVVDQDLFKTIRSPYGDGELLIAMPALKPDVALIHVHESDQAGNSLIFSPDPFFDEMMARAADKVYLSAERIVTTEALDMHKNARFNLFERCVVSAVAEVPFGAHPTGASPDYGIDMNHLKAYKSASDEEAWADYSARYITQSHDEYIDAVGGKDAISSIPAPIY